MHHDPGAPEGASRPLWTERDLRRGAQGCVGTSRQATGDIQGGVRGSGRAGTLHDATGKGEGQGKPDREDTVRNCRHAEVRHAG